MTSPYLVMVTERMAECDGNIALKALRDSIPYTPAVYPGDYDLPMSEWKYTPTYHPHSLSETTRRVLKGIFIWSILIVAGVYVVVR